MIFTESTIKISNNVSKMDSTIVLYRGDKNVEIRFTILQSPFKYSNTVATNVIESTNASYGQLVIKTPNDKPPIFSEVSATKEGTVLFTITKEMIDEIEELGVYTFQIRLMDENKQSRVTIPPVENGIEIKEPIAIEDDNSTNVVGLAKANYAVATLSDVDTPAFDDNGQYIKTNWNDGDLITNTSLNKIEEGIYTTNENVTATKKYVDDKVTVKILPVDYNKNCATNVADLEPHSIYMSPNDAKFLYLAYEKLSGSLVGFLFTAKAHGRFIYTGVKDDTKIEIMMEGSCYTVYFKTDTVDAHVEKTVFYLTKNNTTEFTPTTDYEPATKKYVDDNTPIKSLPVNPTTKTAATVDVNNITSSGCYALPKRADGTQWTNLRMRAIVNDGSGNSKVLLLTGYQNFVFHVNIESKKIYCDNLRIVYNIGTTADTTYIDTEPYYLPTTNTKEYTPTNDYNPATKKYVDDKIKTDLGTSELTTTAKDIKGAVNELNTQYKDIVDKKLDKNGILSMANMGQDIKEAMTGGSVAVVGKGAILDENIAEASYVKAVTNNFYKEGLFNATDSIIYDNTYTNVGDKYTQRDVANGLAFGFTYNKDYDKLIIRGIKADNDGTLTIGICEKEKLSGWVTETDAKCLYTKKIPITANEELDFEVDISGMNSVLTKGHYYMMAFYSILDVESPTYNSNNAIYFKSIKDKGELVKETPIEDIKFILNYGGYNWFAIDSSLNSCTYTPAISLREQVITKYECNIDRYVKHKSFEAAEQAIQLQQISNFVPNDIPLIQNDTVEIFYDSIFNVKNIGNYNLKVTNPITDFFERKAKITATEKTQNTTTIVTLVDDFNRELSTANLNFTVFPVKNPSTQKNLLIIGDSLTEFGDSGGCETASTLYEKLQTNNITNINFIGTKSGRNINAKNEGRAGWRSWDYMDINREGNPFVHNKVIDFNAYCTANNFSGIDYCIIHMNWNAFGYGAETMWKTLKELADKLLESYPQCKIFIVGMSAYSKYKYSGNWYCTKETVWEIDKYYQQQCDKLDNFRYISLLPYRDMEYANKYSEVDVNLRNSKIKEKELADHVHCGDIGYQQIADVYFRELIRQINLDS